MRDSSIQPVETWYKGRRLRSRLEARWAAFFEELAAGNPLGPLLWEHEYERYLLSNGESYLPDFWLPQVKMWAEVKPTEPTEAEDLWMKLLAQETGYPCLRLVGAPENKPYSAWERGYEDIVGDNLYNLTCHSDYPFLEGRFWWSADIYDRFPDTAAAVNKAKAARFEDPRDRSRKPKTVVSYGDCCAECGVELSERAVENNWSLCYQCWQSSCEDF